MTDEQLDEEGVETFQRLVEYYGTDDDVGAIAEVVLRSNGEEVPEPDETQTD